MRRPFLHADVGPALEHSFASTDILSAWSVSFLLSKRAAPAASSRYVLSGLWAGIATGRVVLAWALANRLGEKTFAILMLALTSGCVGVMYVRNFVVDAGESFGTEKTRDGNSNLTLMTPQSPLHWSASSSAPSLQKSSPRSESASLRRSRDPSSRSSSDSVSYHSERPESRTRSPRADPRKLARRPDRQLGRPAPVWCGCRPRWPVAVAGGHDWRERRLDRSVARRPKEPQEGRLKRSDCK